MESRARETHLIMMYVRSSAMVVDACARACDVEME